ncbi:MAG: phosphatidate cytidylyltransferase [Planctomycetaceae bacterium]|nr:phosphatidate cytidylyltransferase [Planctomycetaceae bacterium]
MLGWRLAVSAVLIPLLAALFWADQKFGAAAPLLYALCCVLGVRCAWELVTLLRPRFPELQLAPIAAGIVALLTTAWVPHWLNLGTGSTTSAIALVWVMCALVLFAIEAWRYIAPGRRMETLAAGIMAVSYIGALLAVTAQLRWVRGAEAGYYVLASMVIATKMGDVGAYTLGRLFGKRKMAPHLSPGKTWAGFGGALLGAGLGAWLWLSFAAAMFDGVSAAPPLWWSLLYGVVLGLVGLIGDLCESLIKRDMGQKDAAQLMPGFGGLLDLLDSILFAGPVAYILWSWLPQS